ncbi:phosphatase PAP2 family protein [Hymenobacter ginsengisoli]|uniref:Phosphatase PAP2 family protein n=1 Tax=Hymenobacter ginsengisoli TaxID=1051626 RepID=A0ABP8QJH4_9BACT|nr:MULTISPECIES: phosphatase PAP2 family protein [unclassified Hymenobacter]MBO2029900.1 phosphatase PAP2 family protein [Hymenobacter sp. BT559]
MRIATQAAEALRQVHRHRLLALLLAVIVGAWSLFGLVAHELHEDRLQPDQGFPFDRPILNYLHAHEGHGRCALANTLSALSGPVWLTGYGLVALVLGWLAYRRRYRALIFAVGAVGGTMAINLLAKYHFERLRPAFYNQVCFETPTQLTDPSFPSGHTMASLAMACALGILCWPTRWRWLVWGLGLGLALGVAWSRLYLAAHYPSDVLAGWLATIAWVWTLYLVQLRYFGELRQLGHTVREEVEEAI